MRFYWNIHGCTDGSPGHTTEVAHPLISGPGEFDESDLRFLLEAFEEIATDVKIPAEVSNFDCKEKIRQVDEQVKARAKQLKEQNS